MLIVSDTSPITNLIRLEMLNILQKLFEQVIIPEKVYQELTDYEDQHEVLRTCEWIIVEKVKNHDAVTQLLLDLDAGEAEAIVLAQELDANLLIIDERKGRNIAEEKGLAIIGLLGVLVKAKEKGHIEKLKPILDQLKDEIKFRISTNLYDLILKSVHEE